MSDEVHDVPPLVPGIATATDGTHHFVGSRCDACEAVFFGERSVCARCSDRSAMRVIRLADTGKVYSFTIVRRSYPGVKTPFVDVTIDLDGGGHVKGTLEDVEPHPEAIPFDLPVQLRFRETVPVGSDGQKYISYYFVPAANEKRESQ
jgi:uncharacterized OB-fold protein